MKEIHHEAPLHRQDSTVSGSSSASWGQGNAVFLRPKHEGHQFLLSGGLDDGLGYCGTYDWFDQAGDFRGVMSVKFALPALEADTGSEQTFKITFVSGL